ncbi:MAG: type II secretion system protein [Bdellovibrionota bacterium]
MKRRLAKNGFTLLEVMIAVAIMTVAFTAILTSQSGSIFLSIKTKDLNTAGWLAHNIMVDSEHFLEGKPFAEVEKIQSERFKAPFERFAWKREVRELKFPDLVQAAKEGEGIPEPVRILAKTITKYLSTSMRELVITVTWMQGNSEQRLVLTTYLVDLNAEFNFAI